MKVSIYARVCYQDQVALEKQVERLKQYAETNGYIVTSVTAVSGISGLNNRESLQSMIEMAETNDFDAILVTDSSRISRDMVTYMEFVKELEKHGKTVVCMSGGSGYDGMLDGFKRIINSVGIKNKAVFKTDNSR